ncbi:pyridoxal phosphate-dependent aminotransferase [Salinarimonas ramus]|nr:pyridoxal phosphate-dependent aminotransferase [Salinarimonas ramus]
MEQGQMDYPTTPAVIEAATRFMATGQILYTNVDGIDPLKDAIRRKLARENDLDYARDEVFVGAGTSQVVFNAFAVTLEPGDEVVLPTPLWTVFRLSVEALGGVPVTVPTRAQDGFKMTPDALRAAIGPRTRWLVLNSPCNPSGAVYDEHELARLAAVLLEAPRVAILSDDLYEHQIYDDRSFRNIVNAEPRLRERTLVVNGVAKAHGMTGWRIGYGAGPRGLLEAMKWWQAPSTSSPCHVSQWAAVAALDGPQEHLAERRAELRHRRDLLSEALTATPGWSADPCEGAFYLYASCEGLLGRTTPSGARLRTDRDVARWLLEDAHVASVPGEAFELSPFIRFSFGTATDRVAEAARRIRRATDRLS